VYSEDVNASSSRLMWCVWNPLSQGVVLRVHPLVQCPRDARVENVTIAAQVAGKTA
jgi:hypothetical protein